MTRTTLRAAAAAALLTLGAALPAAAQGASPITFNVRAGGALPTGGLGAEVNTGFTLGGGLSLRPATLPFGLRFDGDFNRFGFDDNSGDTYSIWAISANAELAPALSPIYFVGGVGFYSGSVSSGNVTVRDNETNVGFNVGGGFNLPLTGFTSFVEARYHSVSTPNERTNFVPITFGLRF